MVSGPGESKVCQVQVCQAKSAYGVKSSLVLQSQPMRSSDLAIPEAKRSGKQGSCVEGRGRTNLERPKGC